MARAVVAACRVFALRLLSLFGCVVFVDPAAGDCLAAVDEEFSI